MREEQFGLWLERYGTDTRSWPWHRRLLARLWFGSALTARLADEARELEKTLTRQLQPDPLPPALARRLAAIPGQYAQPTTRLAYRPVTENRGLTRLGLAGAMACGVGGLAIGSTGWFGVEMDDAYLAQTAYGVYEPVTATATATATDQETLP